MTNINEEKYPKELRPDCEKCFGLCCVALYFSASDGFPVSKEAGTPCINLQSDFTCTVHKDLMAKGLKGCTAYDCFGAGQKLAQVTFNGHDWHKYPEYAAKMFDAFLIMRQLHEMLWYLTQAQILQTDHHVKEEIKTLIENTKRFTLLDADSLLSLDVDTHRNKVNPLLKNASELVRSRSYNENKIISKKRIASSRRLDYFGSDLRKNNLIGADLRGACLIAANLRGVDLSWADLIGVDLRDADLSGADLTNSIFLTQTQINSAKGNIHTKLPVMIARPSHWLK